MASTPQYPTLRPPSGQLPRTQADWQRFLNDLQSWQQALQVIKWQAPTLGTNIANYGSGWQTAAYAIDSTGRVHLRGLIAGSGLVVGTTIFTLPSGFRPQAYELFIQLGYNGTAYEPCRVDVSSDGSVKITWCASGNPTGWLSLSGISFQVY